MSLEYTLSLPTEKFPVAEAGVFDSVLFGGAGGTRTPDPLLAREVLSQLSYSPTIRTVGGD